MQELSLKERLLILSETIRMTEKAFAHWESATITPDELGEAAKEFFDKAAAAGNRADFQKVMWAYFGSFVTLIRIISTGLRRSRMAGRFHSHCWSRMALGL